MIGEKTKPRVRAAVEALHARGIYPSGKLVSKEMGRIGSELGGNENKYRKEKMAELGIPMKNNRWV